MKYIAILILFFTMIFNFNVHAKQGDEKVFVGWILHMFISGQLKEYTPRGGMAACLKIKRKIMRSQGKDAAAMAKFLLTDESSWITGQIIGVDGGRSSI